MEDVHRVCLGRILGHLIPLMPCHFPTVLWGVCLIYLALGRVRGNRTVTRVLCRSACEPFSMVMKVYMHGQTCQHLGNGWFTHFLLSEILDSSLLKCWNLYCWDNCHHDSWQSIDWLLNMKNKDFTKKNIFVLVFSLYRLCLSVSTHSTLYLNEHTGSSSDTFYTLKWCRPHGVLTCTGAVDGASQQGATLPSLTSAVWDTWLSGTMGCNVFFFY